MRLLTEVSLLIKVLRSHRSSVGLFAFWWQSFVFINNVRDVKTYLCNSIWTLEKKKNLSHLLGMWFDHIRFFGCSETKQVYNVWPALVPRAHYSSSPPSLACMCLSWTFWVIPSDERVPSFSFFIFCAWEQTWNLSNVLHKKVSICLLRSKKGGGSIVKSLIYWTQWSIDLDDLLI